VTRFVVEADGGSRGNPGPAAYGTVVKDGETGAVLREIAEHIGTASNNVAEYRGLIAGLEAVRELDPSATVEARLDSKLVVEQLSGRWKVKHPDMRVLALRGPRGAAAVAGDLHLGAAGAEQARRPAGERRRWTPRPVGRPGPGRKHCRSWTARTPRPRAERPTAPRARLVAGDAELGGPDHDGAAPPR
jgi:probable phosphoglycerate mutase